MKMISAVIKHFKLDEVRDALVKAGVEGMTISEVKGFGKQKGHVEVYRGARFEVNLLPKVKLDIAVRDERLDEVVDIVVNAARTGEIGDGKIFVYDLETAVRIRTGEKGEEAL
jgi:nitrogen regulatory protein P-II 2